MDMFTATEESYKNGYKKGQQDIIEKIKKVIDPLLLDDRPTMKELGDRSIDDLGRVCIPKSIRSEYNIVVGESFSIIFNEKSQDIILRRIEKE